MQPRLLVNAARAFGVTCAFLGVLNAYASPVLRCKMLQGDSSFSHEVMPTRDPYTFVPIDILNRFRIDAGADAVVGGHPHVIQDTEHYRGKPIIYSLGNFVFDGFDSLPTTTGWLVQMDVSRDGVLAWKAHAARLNRQGTPRLQSATPGQCWQKGRPQNTDCS